MFKKAIQHISEFEKALLDLKIIARVIFLSSLFFIFCSYTHPPFAPSLTLDYGKEFDQYQGVFTRKELSEHIQSYLQKHKEIENHYLLSDHAFQLFATEEDKRKGKPEFTLKLSSAPRDKKRKSPPASLKGLRIALDPGHLGGDFALLEERYVKMIYTRPKEAIDPIFFKEGTLALMTALLLRDWFEKDGAVVFITKERDGEAVYDQTFFEWLATDGYKHSPPLPRGIGAYQSLSKLYSAYYNRLDLRARAEKVNAFHPDLTLIIHYNAQGERDPFTQENFPENYNYNMVFTGGGFGPGELADLSSRKEFLRLLLSDDLDQSLNLSRHVIAQMTEKLNVPPVSDTDPAPYLKRAAIKVCEGVYARNLFLTRMIQGALCYGESLCQDHREECVKLNATNFEVNGILGPERVRQVARAYYEAVEAYLNSPYDNTCAPPLPL